MKMPPRLVMANCPVAAMCYRQVLPPLLAVCQVALPSCLSIQSGSRSSRPRVASLNARCLAVPTVLRGLASTVLREVPPWRPGTGSAKIVAMVEYSSDIGTAAHRPHRARRRLAGVAITLGSVALTVFTGPAALAGEHGGSGELTRPELRRAVAQVLEDAGFVGISVEVRDGNKRFAARAGRAELDSDRPVPYRSSLRAASATKSFVAVVVLQLASEGRLSLDDTVEERLPGVVSGNGNDGSRITMRQLLQHTSGIYNYYYFNDLGDDAAAFERHRFDHVSADQLIAGAMKHSPEFQPGTAWSYSNPNYVLTGQIIERVTGHSWEQEVRDRIIEPLRLTGTYAPGDDPFLPEPHTHTYHRYPGSDEYTDTTVRNMSWGGAAGELVSTERDLDTFFTALIDGKLLPAEQLEEIQTVVEAGEDYQRAFPDLHYGLGLMRQPLSCGGYRWGHGGDVEGATIRDGVTADGERSIVINATGKTDDDKQVLRAEAALQGLTDTMLCEGMRG